MNAEEDEGGFLHSLILTFAITAMVMAGVGLLIGSFSEESQESGLEFRARFSISGSDDLFEESTTDTDDLFSPPDGDLFDDPTTGTGPIDDLFGEPASKVVSDDLFDDSKEPVDDLFGEPTSDSSDDLFAE